MLTLLLSVLKYSLIVLGSALGIYGTVHDYKSDGHLTREGRLALRAMIAVGILTVITAAFEQYASYHDAQERIRRERLAIPLSDITVEWKVSPAASKAFSDVMQAPNGGKSPGESNIWLLYIATAEYGGELAVQKNIIGWSLTVTLQRPQGELFRQFDQNTPEWAAFERAVQHLVGERFELSLVNGSSIFNLAGGAWPMELLISHSTVSFHIFAPRVSPLDLSKSDITFVHRGDFRPTQLRITTTDPRAQIDQTIALTWKEKLWRTVIDREGEPYPLYQYESNPVRVAENIAASH